MKQTKEELWAVASEFYKLKSEGKNPIVQYLDRNNTWNDYNDLCSLDAPYFDDGDVWRLKPETIQHKGGKYPKPCTNVDELIKAGVAYKPSFYIGDDGRIKPSYTEVSVLIKGMAKSGLYYLNQDDAIERAKVIYEID